VHDLRVEARRLLSLLDLLARFLAPTRREKAHRVLKEHLDSFDELRDTHVQLPAARKFREQFAAAGKFYRFLKKREARLTCSTCKRIRKLRTGRLSKAIRAARQDVESWMDRAGSRRPDALLLSAVNHAFARTNALREQIDPADTHSIHCTRIAFKKFRYVLEALAEDWPCVSKELLLSLRRYQTLMGDVQDAEVLLRAFKKFLRKHTTESRSAVRFEHELQKRRQDLIDKYMTSADQLLQFWPPSPAPKLPPNSAAAARGSRLRRAKPTPNPKSS
jgi:CHAD domain-containing protein